MSNNVYCKWCHDSGQISYICSACCGSGEGTSYSEEMCSRCKGSGTVNVPCSKCEETYTSSEDRPYDGKYTKEGWNDTSTGDYFNSDDYFRYYPT